MGGLRKNHRIDVGVEILFDEVFDEGKGQINSNTEFRYRISSTVKQSTFFSNDLIFSNHNGLFRRQSQLYSDADNRLLTSSSSAFQRRFST